MSEYAPGVLPRSDKTSLLPLMESGEDRIKSAEDQSRTLLLEVQRLQNRVIELDQNSMVRIARIIELDQTAKNLLAILGHTSNDTDLLQVGIEAIVKLLRVKYGAIGILDESDKSGETLRHFIHTGISPEVEKSIGTLP